MTQPKSSDIDRGHATWKEKHELAVAAAEAAWRYACDHVAGREVVATPGTTFLWKPGFEALFCDIGAGFHLLDSQFFFAVDKDLDPDVLANRMMLEYQSRKGKKLYLGIPDNVLCRLGHSEHSLRVFQTDSQEQLARLWADALADIDQGPQAADLWSSLSSDVQEVSPTYLPENQALNADQRKALGAMTTPGGHFVWGPPGTGKTTVIASAIKDALDHGRSVLLTSHTNVAVDNALMSLVSIDQRYDLGLLKPGRVVRKKPSSDPERLSRDVLDHEFLTDDKAAAVMVNLADRLAQIDAKEADNRHHADRARENDIRDQVHAMDLDDNGIRQLDKHRVEYDQLIAKSAEQQRARDEFHSCEQLTRDCQQKIEQYANIDQQTGDAFSALSAKRQQAEIWAGREHQAAEEVNETATMLQEASSHMTSLAQPSALPWVRASRRKAMTVLEEQCKNLRQVLDTRQHSLTRAQENMSAAGAEIQTLKAQYDLLYETSIKVGRVHSRLEESQSRQQGIQDHLGQLDHEYESLRAVVGDPAAFHQRLVEAERNGSLALIREWDELEARVKILNEEQKAISEERAKLEDEYRKTKKRLLQEAPVIATTLDSLMFSQELLQRRFDVVIVDEVASAEAAKVFFTASKAESTCALVGDFLQNAPVADAEDPTTEDERIVANWQKKDIFELSGIVDRASAEAHPHCFPLRLQYRFPPIIADAINAFCYDGLLQSAQSAGAGIVISFHDTSNLPDVGFRKVNGSWQCDTTAGIAMEIIPGSDAGSIGFVTPYAAQADRAKVMFDKRGFSVEAGTAHRFQGREFDTVIVDLMQDGQPRWISRADIHGNEAGRSASKILNVALTRAKRRLHLIGNWEYIRHCETPGMKALASLQDNPAFELLRV